MGNSKTMFLNRESAGFMLAQALQEYKDCNGIVVAIPRGGLPLGYVVAKSLNLPLGIVLSKKIGHPLHKEYAVGAVSLNGRLLRNHENVSKEYIERETKRIRQSLEKRYAQFYGDRKPLSFWQKTVIIIDDGVATGSTILSTVELIREQQAAKVIIAVPVGSPRSILELRTHPWIDEVICLETPDNFRAVGRWYWNFRPVSDKKAIDYFKKANQLHQQLNNQ